MKKKTSAIWLMDKEKFIELVKTSNSIRQILKYFDLESKGGNFRTLKARIEFENIDITHIQEYHKNRIYSVIKTLPLEKVLVENSTYGRGHLKKRIIKEHLIEYKCKDCGNTGDWNGKKLSLQLEHINGKHDDHRLKNLCFLCPNCHSQTDTYAGKRFKKRYTCKICGKNICKEAEICPSCFYEGRKKFEVSKEELEKFIKEMPFTKIGEMFGVSDNTIRKRAKRLGIILPVREEGYWQKVEAGKI